VDGLAADDLLWVDVDSSQPCPWQWQTSRSSTISVSRSADRAADQQRLARAHDCVADSIAGYGHRQHLGHEHGAPV